MIDSIIVKVFSKPLVSVVLWKEMRKKSLGRELRVMNTNVICCQMDSEEKATFSEAFLFHTDPSYDSAILQKEIDW